MSFSMLDAPLYGAAKSRQKLSFWPWRPNISPSPKCSVRSFISYISWEKWKQSFIFVIQCLLKTITAVLLLLKQHGWHQEPSTLPSNITISEYLHSMAKWKFILSVQMNRLRISAWWQSIFVPQVLVPLWVITWVYLDSFVRECENIETTSIHAAKIQMTSGTYDTIQTCLVLHTAFFKSSIFKSFFWMNNIMLTLLRKHLLWIAHPCFLFCHQTAVSILSLLSYDSSKARRIQLPTIGWVRDPKKWTLCIYQRVGNLTSSGWWLIGTYSRIWTSRHSLVMNLLSSPSQNNVNSMQAMLLMTLKDNRWSKILIFINSYWCV